MARTCRNNLPNVVYHCITRFVDREWFFEDDEERAHYLRLLGRALKHSDWRCIAYALMSNHIHLAMIAGNQPLESWAKAAHSPFAQWMNRRHGRLGPVMAERPKDFRILTENVGSVIAYIHNNPVRAGVVKRAAESSWTSHQAYLDTSHVPMWLDVGEGLARAGFEDPHVFDEWVGRTPGNAFDVAIERQAVMMRRRGALVLGTPTVHTEDSKPVSWDLFGRPFYHARVDPRRVIEVVAELADVATPVIRSRRRLPAACDARRVIAHCSAALGLTPSDMSAALGISVQAVCAMRRRDLGEHVRIVHDLAFERLCIEIWGYVPGAGSPPATPTQPREDGIDSDGVPNRISGSDSIG